MPEAIDERFLTDWSGLTRGTPGELHRPRSTAEVAALVRRCHAECRPVTVQGGLAGLAGGAVPADGDVVINLERMGAIEEIDELEGVMYVQAGATLQPPPGPTVAALAALAALESAFEAGLISDGAIAASLSDVEAFWRLRQSIPELLAHLKPSVNFDCGLPLRHIPGSVERVDAAMQQAFPVARHLFFGHLGDNNIHLMTGPHRVEDRQAVDELVYRELQGFLGTISAEHGIDFIKKPFLTFTRNDGQIQLLRSLKQALDPQGRLNPGRVLD